MTMITLYTGGIGYLAPLFSSTWTDYWQNCYLHMNVERIHSDGPSLCSYSKQSQLGIIGQGTGLVWETMLHTLQQNEQIHNNYTIK